MAATHPPACNHARRAGPCAGHLHQDAQKRAHLGQPQGAAAAHVQALLRPHGAAAAEAEHQSDQWAGQAHARHQGPSNKVLPAQLQAPRLLLGGGAPRADVRVRQGAGRRADGRDRAALGAPLCYLQMGGIEDAALLFTDERDRGRRFVVLRREGWKAARWRQPGSSS
eukprot:363570-Chlamydomonas_euryale.AAC.11